MNITYPTGFMSCVPHNELSEPTKEIIQAHWDKLPPQEREKVLRNLSEWIGAGSKAGASGTVPVKVEHL